MFFWLGMRSVPIPMKFVFHMLEAYPPGAQFVSAPAETNNLCVLEVCLNARKTNFTTQGLVSRVGKQTQATIVELVSQPRKQTRFRKSLFSRRRNKLHLCARAGTLAGFRRGLPARVQGLAGTLSRRPCGGLACLRPAIHPPTHKLKKVAFLQKENACFQRRIFQGCFFPCSKHAPQGR